MAGYEACDIESYDTVIKYTRHVNILGSVGICSAVLSFAGSVSIIGYSIGTRVCFHSKVQPLFHLACGDLLLSLCWISSSLAFFTNLHDEEDTMQTFSPNRAFTCFKWQLITQIIHMMTFFLTLNYSFNVYYQMKLRVQQFFPMLDASSQSTCIKSLNVAKQIFYVVAWLLPIALLIPIMVRVNTDKIDACKQCILLIDIPRLKNDSYADYGYIVWIASLTIVILLIMMLYFKTLRLYWSAIPGFHTNRERRRFTQMRIRISCYIFVFLVCWLPSFVLAAVKWYEIKNLKHYDMKEDLNKCFILYLFQAILAPLQGFLNSLVYGWTRKSFRHSRNRTDPEGEEGIYTRRYESIPSIEESGEISRRESILTESTPLGY